MDYFVSVLLCNHRDKCAQKCPILQAMQPSDLFFFFCFAMGHPHLKHVRVMCVYTQDTQAGDRTSDNKEIYWNCVSLKVMTLI